MEGISCCLNNFRVIEVLNAQKNRYLKTSRSATKLKHDANLSILLASPGSLDARHFNLKVVHMPAEFMPHPLAVVNVRPDLSRQNLHSLRFRLFFIIMKEPFDSQFDSQHYRPQGIFDRHVPALNIAGSPVGHLCHRSSRGFASGAGSSRPRRQWALVQIVVHAARPWSSLGSDPDRLLSVPESRNVMRRAAGTAIAPTLSSCVRVRDTVSMVRPR
jgi:hypothetical protein